MILPSRKHTYIILTPYLVKLGFTEAHIIFLISAKKHKILVTRLKPPRRGGSNEPPQSMF